MISAVVALDEKRGIGKKDGFKGLPWDIPADFKRMRQLTDGHPLIMGRKTHEIIGRVLPNRTNIIITRDRQYKVEGAVVVHSLSEALKVARKSPGSSEIIIFGGGEIFKEALPLIDVLHLTVVKGDHGADTFFPEYKEEFTKVLFREKGEDNGFEYEFIDLARE